MKFPIRHALSIGAVVAFLLLCLTAYITGRHAFLPANPPSFAYPFPISKDADLAKQIGSIETRMQFSKVNTLELNTLASLYLDEAERTGDARKITRAEKLIRRAIRLDSSDKITAPLLLARVSLQRHRYEDAIRRAQRVLEISDPENPEALSIIATSRFEIGHLEEAARIADLLIELSPSTASMALRARVLLAQGREAEGLHELSRAMRVEDASAPRASIRARAYWARYAIDHGRLDEAEQALTASMTVDLKDSEVLSLVAELRAKQERWGEAQNFYQRAYSISKDPRHLLEMTQIQKIRGFQAPAAAARARLEHDFRQNPALVGTYPNEFVDLLIAKGAPKQMDEAIEVMKRELAARATPENYARLAACYAATARWKDAKSAIDAALRKAPAKATVLALAARIHKALGKSSLAEVYVAQARQIDPTYDNSLVKW